jgi:uncharacterized protein YdcH (DUF465 family)
MGKPKKNKKAEIKTRRKTRKTREQISALKGKEKRIKQLLNQYAEMRDSLVVGEESRSLEEESPESVQNTPEILE